MSPNRKGSHKKSLTARHQCLCVFDLLGCTPFCDSYSQLPELDFLSSLYCTLNARKNTAFFNVSLTTVTADKLQEYVYGGPSGNPVGVYSGSLITVRLPWIQKVKCQKKPTVSGQSWRSVWKETARDKRLWQQQRQICSKCCWYLFTVSRPDWTPCLLCDVKSSSECDGVGRLHSNHHHCCGKHMAAAHETPIQTEFTSVHCVRESRGVKFQIEAAAFI